MGVKVISVLRPDQRNHSNLEVLSVLICFCKEDWATVPPQQSETVIATYHKHLVQGTITFSHTGPVGLVRYFPLIHEIIT